MATSNTCSVSTESFKMPEEPCPLPSLGSDEESFVVLWKDMDSKSIIGINHDPIGTSVVEEAKQLINKELTEIEQFSLINKPETQIENNSVDGPSEQCPRNGVGNKQMEESTVLPKMPQVERGMNASDIISITTLSTDLTSEQVQKKVSEIVEENIKLKDTILQNNMSMKSQYERIVAWQEDVQKVHQAHKEKIMEAKEFIERLKKENFNLIRELEQAKTTKNVQDEEVISLKQALMEKAQCTQEKLVRSSDDNLKEFELDVANKKVKDLEEANRNLTVENTDLKEDKTKLIRASEKVEEYEKELDRLQSALHATKKELEEAKMELLKVKSTDEEKLKSLNEVVESLRSQLYFTTKQQTMQPTQEELANVRQQLANTQIALTQMDHARSVANAQVEALNKDIAELKLKLETSQTQSDEVFALKAQLDVYKADFEAEKSAKETIKTDKEKLVEDMQNLQRRNQQLQEEIDMLRENHDYVVPPAHSAVSASTASVSSNEHPLKCPVCNFGFKTHQALQTHVYRCIELDDHLP